MEQPLVSIIIPSYNRVHLISETLDSVISQIYTNWECIVVDDGSTDNTEALLKEYTAKDNRIQFYIRPSDRPKGANACRNYGFELSKGKYVNWLDSDDIFDNHHLNFHILEHLEKSNVDMSISKSGLFNKKIGDLNGYWANINPEVNDIDEMISGKISWSTLSVMWKRKSLPNRPFVECLQCAQEWTFNLSMLINKLNYEIIDNKTVYVRRHEQRVGKSQNPEKFFSEVKSRVIIFDKLISEGILTNENEYFLIKKIFQGVKKTVRSKEKKIVLKEMRILFSLFMISNFKFEILRILFVGIPIYLFIGRGESIFKI
ncbi:glycosyltransferase family 2 protein [Lutibacter oricola]|nr:glycosyltransferase family 2 protein [Lutibacter oricola]